IHSEPTTGGGQHADLHAQIHTLREEIARLRGRGGAPADTGPLARRLAESTKQVEELSARNDKLVVTLREARAQLLELREEVDRLAQPPSGDGVFLAPAPDDAVDVYTGGRRMRLMVSPNVDRDALRLGQRVRLNEALTVVEAGEYDRAGEV